MAGRESHSSILDTIPKHDVASLKGLLGAIFIFGALADSVSKASDGTEHTRCHKITLEARREKVLAKIAAAQVGPVGRQEKCSAFCESFSFDVQSCSTDENRMKTG